MTEAPHVAIESFIDPRSETVWQCWVDADRTAQWWWRFLPVIAAMAARRPEAMR